MWVHKSGHICAECAGLKTRCSLCGLPVKDGFAKTGDGRFICQREVQDAVLTADEARQIFSDTSLELRRLARGGMELKFTDVNVGHFDVDYWNPRDGKPVPEALRRLGFSPSRAVGDSFHHTVVLLSGQLRSDYAAVCAHEYTHLWLNENKPAARVIEPATIEAICGLSAYKLMAERRDDGQLKKSAPTPARRGGFSTSSRPAYGSAGTRF